MKWFKRASIVILFLLLVGSGVVYRLTATMVGEKDSHPPVIQNQVTSFTELPEKDSLLVMTQNIAHGRADGANQILQSSSSIEANLRNIAPVFLRVNPDVIALQEADAPSIWSGNFNHVQFLAEEAQFPYYVQGDHVQSSWLTYGTAVLSKLPISTTRSITFSPTPPTPAKGFVVATVEWPDGSGKVVDIVSIHLDFSRNSVRDEQVEELIQLLSQRENPVIVMGDFNSDWQTKDSPVPTLVQELDLQAYEPESQAFTTYPLLNTRVDWILISNELAFKTYDVLSDLVSDHAAVVSEIIFMAETTYHYR